MGRHNNSRLVRNWEHVYHGVCETCGGKVELHWNTKVFDIQKPTGAVYSCENYPECNSYTTCIHGTTVPRGVVADYKVRGYRARAHESFDWLWESGNMRRREAYVWLSGKMKMPQYRCHIGKFNKKQCLDVIKYCEEIKHTLQSQ